MKYITMNTSFFCRKISHDDILLYNPKGSAYPLVLTGKAKFIFSTIKNRAKICEDELSEISAKENIGKIDLQNILEELSLEKIILIEGKTAKTVSKEVKPRKNKLSFWIHITDQCQLNCDYCYIKKRNRTMRIEVFRTLLESIKNNLPNSNTCYVHLKFAGGEPLLKFNLLQQMVSETRESLEPMGVKLIFSIITNAISITPPICEYLKKEKFIVSVSLDGISTYNRARKYKDGRNSFGETLRGIKEMINSGINPHILTVVSNDNIDGLDGLVSLMTEYKLGMTLILCRAVNDDGSLILDINSTRKKLLKQFRLWKKLPNNKLPDLEISTLKFKGKRTSTCAAGKSYFSIGPNGEVGSCQMMVDEPLIHRLVAGDSFKAISMLDIQRNLPSECTSCTWRYVCFGGCKVLAQRSGNLLTRSPLCSIIRSIVPELLEIEGRKIQMQTNKEGGLL